VTTASRLQRVWGDSLVMTNRDSDLVRDLCSQSQPNRLKEK
jgi:hypothetical protein